MMADLLLLLIILVCVLSGYRKGLLLSLCTLLVLVLSCLGAAAAQETLTPKAEAWLEPRVTAYFSERMQDFITENAGETAEQAANGEMEIGGHQVDLSGITGLLDNLGVDIPEAAENVAKEISAPLVGSAAETASKILVETVAGGLIFCLSFFVIYMLLHGAMLAVNLADRLPVIHRVNHVGGAVVGLLSGAFFLTMAIALLVRTGVLGEDVLQGSVAQLLRKLAENIS